ncbi:hypothetical protein KQX54_005038 [Cotesia glomerata]|uniref:Uncharacterized protein n=1 Tax=Cotesia glomerata TaxID=32391 RepID=A0AAV7ICZ9_COTGL|nr:hypothetical protein KQX54_005038 [Cotesia glomerata]
MIEDHGGPLHIVMLIVSSDDEIRNDIRLGAVKRVRVYFPRPCVKALIVIVIVAEGTGFLSSSDPQPRAPLSRQHARIPANI